MKRLLYFLFAAALFLPAHAHCEQSPSPLLLGRWTVDVSRLPIPPQARPKSVTVTFSQAEDGRLATRVEVIDSAGAMTFAEGVTALDGTPAPVQGNLEADTAAATMPTPAVLVMQLARANVPGSTRIYTVSPDGTSMTETAANFGADGRPMMRVNYFTRIEE
jgi:hypothetical protein